MNRNRPGSRLRSGLVVIATGLSTLFPPPLEGAAPRAEDRRHRHVCSPAPALSPEEAELFQNDDAALCFGADPLLF